MNLLVEILDDLHRINSYTLDSIHHPLLPGLIEEVKQKSDFFRGSQQSQLGSFCDSKRAEYNSLKKQRKLSFEGLQEKCDKLDSYISGLLAARYKVENIYGFKSCDGKIVSDIRKKEFKEFRKILDGINREELIRL